jgi:hypothetical protein
LSSFFSLVLWFPRTLVFAQPASLPAPLARQSSVPGPPAHSLLHPIRAFAHAHSAEVTISELLATTTFLWRARDTHIHTHTRARVVQNTQITHKTTDTSRQTK